MNATGGRERRRAKRTEELIMRRGKLTKKVDQEEETK